MPSLKSITSHSTFSDSVFRPLSLGSPPPPPGYTPIRLSSWLINKPNRNLRSPFDPDVRKSGVIKRRSDSGEGPVTTFTRTWGGLGSPTVTVLYSLQKQQILDRKPRRSGLTMSLRGRWQTSDLKIQGDGDPTSKEHEDVNVGCLTRSIRNLVSLIVQGWGNRTYL